MKIDFFATKEQYLEHMLPIATKLEARGYMGTLYITNNLVGAFNLLHLKDVQVVSLKDTATVELPINDNPTVIASTGDLGLIISGEAGSGRRRIKIFMEHGVGITFGHPGYAGGTGIRKYIDCFLAPNLYIRNKTMATLPGVQQFIIGTPKLDKWQGRFDREQDFQDADNLARKKPRVCISFHWDCKVAPESGNALNYFMGILKELKQSKDFDLAGHGHPRIIHRLRKDVYEPAGISTLMSFDDVLRMADVYVNDCSSTLYEFCVTGRPVVIMNSPRFRKNVHHGIRFWDYTDIGPQVDRPEDLADKIMLAYNNQEQYVGARRKMIHDLYPFLGISAEVAASFLIENFGE